ncbi:MAG: stage III sporulation protein AB [Brotaphodocola sp.]
MLSVLLRIIGCICVVSGTSMYGVWLSGQYSGHLAELEQLRHMIFLLKGQILYANAPLHEAFETVGERVDGDLAELFTRVAHRIEEQPGEIFSEIWKAEVEKLGDMSKLSKEDRQSLGTLGDHLGFLDRDMQERNLLLYLEQLDLRIQDMREHKKERCRLYTSLGVMSGLFLAILFI